MKVLISAGLVENKNDLEIQRKDPKSPLYSVKSFEALNMKPQLLKGVYGMGFNAPSKIQETALPTLLADPPQNMIAQSQSGTGKTAAFVLAMLSRVDVSKSHPQVLLQQPFFLTKNVMSFSLLNQPSFRSHKASQLQRQRQYNIYRKMLQLLVFLFSSNVIHFVHKRPPLSAFSYKGNASLLFYDMV